MAAWREVARRIAHEIKNPLTPIQLSAERLKRKYINQIKEDTEVFSQCTDTIIHHVGDIGRMINEFSAFARMPEPVMNHSDIVRYVKETAIFQQQAHDNINITLSGLLAAERDGGVAELVAFFDTQQVRQALTNIMQNAIDSVELAGLDDKRGHVDVRLDVLSGQGGDHELAITVSDNGPGLPDMDDINKLTEPYVTHKEKGTGLGLAIVQKIMQDHKGRLILGKPDWLDGMEGYAALGGATVVLLMPVDNSREEGGENAAGVEAA